MVSTLLQTVGVVFTSVLLVVTVVVTMYFSYLLGVGILLVGLLFVVYHLLSMLKKGAGS